MPAPFYFYLQGFNHFGPDIFPQDCAADIVFHVDVENDDGQSKIPAQGNSRRIHDFQPEVKDFLVAYPFEPFGRRVDERVIGIDAVYFGRLQDDVKAAAVSVVKKGLPSPALKTTTLPFSRCLMALLLIKGSATASISSAETCRAAIPSFSMAS